MCGGNVGPGSGYIRKHRDDSDERESLDVKLATLSHNQTNDSKQEVLENSTTAITTALYTPKRFKAAKTRLSAPVDDVESVDGTSQKGDDLLGLGLESHQ